MYQKIRIGLATLSMILFPLSFYYLSPALSIMGPAEGLLTGSLIVFIMLFVSSIFLGRVFCSWVCPAGAIQDQISKTRSRRVHIQKLGWIKFAVWIPWLITVLAMFNRAGGVKAIDFFYQTEMGVSITRPEAALLYGLIVIFFYLLSMIVGRRASCHTICWMAPFMILGKKLGDILKIPSLRLKRESSKCSGCRKCSEVCPMSLEVENLAKDSEFSDHNCILCGICVESCSNNVIKIGVGRG